MSVAAAHFVIEGAHGLPVEDISDGDGPFAGECGHTVVVGEHRALRVDGSLARR